MKKLSFWGPQAPLVMVKTVEKHTSKVLPMGWVRLEL